ncbi:MAG TPA: molybdenum cofactor guanylyltransferase [Psychromonas sp.]
MEDKPLVGNDLKIAGIVLAGGLSVRMGQDKAQLRLQQQSLLARAVLLLESLGLAQVFVSGNYPGYSCIGDLHPQLGPLAGLDACVNALYEDYDALFIVPVDMPLLTASQCHSLLQQFIDYPQGVFYQDSTFPMLLPLNVAIKNYLAEVLTTAEKKQRSLHRLLQKLKAQAIRYPQAQAFRFQNSNTPEQWAQCLEIYNHLEQEKL